MIDCWLYYVTFQYKFKHRKKTPDKGFLIKKTNFVIIALNSQVT